MYWKHFPNTNSSNKCWGLGPAINFSFWIWLHWPFLFSPSQALPPEVKVLLPLLPALPLKLFHGLSTYQGRRIILGSVSQLLVSFSTCIVSCSCFPGHLHCRWGHMEATHSALMTMDRQIFIPQHGGTIVGQYKPGNLSILFSINLENAKSTSTLLSQLLGQSQMLSSLVSSEHIHLSWCRFLPAEPWSHCVTSAVPLLVTGLSLYHFTPEFYF